MKNGIAQSIFILFGFVLISCGTPVDRKSIPKEEPATPSSSDTTVLSPVPSMPIDFPSFEALTDSGNYKLDDSDWRQLEFISSDQKSLVELEMQNIRVSMKKEVTLKNGKQFYKNIFLRKRIRSSLHLKRSGLSAFFSSRKKNPGKLSFREHPGQVKNGFTVFSGDLVLYGQCSGDMIAVLAIPHKEGIRELPEGVSEFLKKEHLLLVDWETGYVEESDGTLKKNFANPVH